MFLLLIVGFGLGAGYCWDITSVIKSTEIFMAPKFSKGFFPICIWKAIFGISGNRIHLAGVRVNLPIIRLLGLQILNGSNNEQIMNSLGWGLVLALIVKRIVQLSCKSQIIWE